MGFRNLEVFNQSLLAAQCWRILSRKESLAARVLKACYFSDTDFVNALATNLASFLWKSLMWGKEIVDAGIRGKIGDGKTIRIYKDKWIPRPSTFKILSRPVLGENANVNQLFTSTSKWNVDLIKAIFCEEDVIAILSILLGRRVVKDSFQWHYDQKRVIYC